MAEFLPSILAGDVWEFLGWAAGPVAGTGGWVSQLPAVPRLQAMGGLEGMVRERCPGSSAQGSAPRRLAMVTVALASSLHVNLGVSSSKGSLLSLGP